MSEPVQLNGQSFQTKPCANDNGDKRTPITIKISCDLPQGMAIISGEAALIARFMGDLLRMTTNDK